MKNYKINYNQTKQLMNLNKSRSIIENYMTITCNKGNLIYFRE